MGKKLGHLFQYIRFGLLTGAAVLIALGLEMPAAFADKLAEWGYDSKTRSLTLTVPPNIAPSVSVLAPDRLLIEIPDTQIGDVAGLTVGDGIVDSIVLEQMTPETLWVVMEFAEGTVLANMQSMAPVGDRVEAGQQWEVRPSVVASNEPAFDARADESAPIVSGGADILRTPEVDVAQADFPDLPVLEPGITLNEPVSVPPIDAAPSAVAPPPPPPPPIAEARPVEEAPDAIAADDRGEVAASADVPSEPPFLGEGTFEVPVLDETALSERAPRTIADEPNDVINAPAVVSVPDEPVIEADDSPAESIAAEPPAIEADAVLEDTVASVPYLQTRVDASVAVEAGPNADELESEFEPQELDLTGQRITPQNVDRWPDPIPFGAPLP